MPDWDEAGDRPDELFVFMEGSVRPPHEAIVDDEDDCEEGEGVSLPAAGTLWFDSYINTFYERYWRDFTIVDQLCVEIEVEGIVQIEILRHAPIGGVSVAVRERIGDSQKRTRHVIPVPDPKRAARDVPAFFGRVWCGLKGIGKGARFISGRWATPIAPVNEPKVGIAMCTFNKPTDVVRNLKTIAAAFEQEPRLSHFVIVDQGNRKVTAEPDFASVAGLPGLKDRLSIVNQDNLGGAGGFTRGMMETFKDSSNTHVLLMDDDIEVDATVLVRLMSVLRYLKRPTVVGGQMFDLFYKNVMHAHAETIDPETGWCRPLIPYGQDMAMRGRCDIFLEPVVGGYNAWWFCCIPREAVIENGLPLPCFVRADDMEFGTRLTSAGFPLVTFPGIFVYHEPFYAKITAWMVYYDCRNAVVLGDLRFGPAGNSRMEAYWERFYGYLSSNLFDHCEAMILGLQDYLKGPNYIYGNTTGIHKEIVAKINRLRLPPTIGKIGDVDPGLSVRLRGRLRRLQRYLWIYYLAPGAEKARSPGETGNLAHLSADFTFGRSELFILNQHTGERYQLRPNPKLARQMTRRLRALIGEWRRRSQELSSAYAQAAQTLKVVEAWSAYVKVDPEAYRQVDRPAMQGDAVQDESPRHAPKSIVIDGVDPH